MMNRMLCGNGAAYDVFEREDERQEQRREIAESLYPPGCCSSESWDWIADEVNSETLLDMIQQFPCTTLRVILRALQMSDKISTAPPHADLQLLAELDERELSAWLFSRAIEQDEAYRQARINMEVAG